METNSEISIIIPNFLSELNQNVISQYFFHIKSFYSASGLKYSYGDVARLF